MASRWWFCVLAAAISALMPAAVRASDPAPLGDAPAAAIVQSFLATPSPSFEPTGIGREQYLKLIAANIDFFHKLQNADGAIIDPYQKREIQYSTPAFALAAAALVAHANRTDLLPPATAAMTWATHCLATHHAADGHSDFYIPMLMETRRLLKDRVPAETLTRWDAELTGLDIAKAYDPKRRGMNWNIVSTAGELLRRQAGLVRPDQMDSQLQFLEQSLAAQQPHFTRFGMYQDPNAPLAYDEFARLWLELMMARDAYHGPLAGTITNFLRDGGLSTLLLLSPTGEWASGGRSAFHQWNEAQTTFICEIEANRWKSAGRDDVAGTFKRAAHLAFQSIQRWQRPTGELWIVKNHADPATRLGYEGYSSATQYNLLPMAMLAMACEHADDSIPEHPTPAEAGSYVFDLRDIFHKVVAAAGGYYVLIDTDADPHYNATGLQRIQRAGVPFSPLSDSTAAQRAYEPTNGPKQALSPGIAWEPTSAPGHWHSLAGQRPTSVELAPGPSDPNRASLELLYRCSDADGSTWSINEHYSLSSAGVDVTDRVDGPPAAIRFTMPALISDGRDKTHITLAPAAATINWDGSLLEITLLGHPAAAAMQLTGDPVACHNGLTRQLISERVQNGHEIHWQARLTAAGRD